MNEVNSESNYLCRRYVHGRKKSPRWAGSYEFRLDSAFSNTIKY